MSDDAGTEHARPGVLTTLALIVGAVGFMAVFFGLYRLAGVGEATMGLLFLVYWAAIMRQDFHHYLPAVAGGATGILLGWSLVAGPALYGTAGRIMSLVALGVVLFCFMRGHARLLVNNATMLFLTVATVSGLGIATAMPTMLVSLAIGAAYMGGVAGLVHFLTARQRRAAA